MTGMDIRIQGLSPRAIGPDCPQVTVGRSSVNDLVVEHPSISRTHARFLWRDGRITLEDLGSRNGSVLNGRALEKPTPVRAGDRIQLGQVRVELAEHPPSGVVIEPAAGLPPTSVVLSAADLRGGALPVAGSGRWTRILAFVQEMTLALIRNGSPRQLLEELTAGLFEFLGAEHGMVMLRGEHGALEAAVVRSRRDGQAVRLSQAPVEAATVRREAILLRDPLETPDLASDSLMFSGVTTAIVTPLEAEGQVIGLLYFDALLEHGPFDEDDLRLAATLAHVAAAKLHNTRLQQEVERTRALEQEMALARAIQQRLVPPPACAGEGFQLAAHLRPAAEVGGDLYDYVQDGGRLQFCIGDVAGKGVGAALVMALTKTLFRAHAAFLQDPAAILRAMNRRLYEETDARIFVTAFCGSLDLASGRLACANAGHDLPLLLAVGAPVRTLEAAPGLALGVLPDRAYALQETLLQPGEGLLLYTDGITEAVDAARAMFTRDRARAVLEDRGDEAPEALVRRLLAAVDAFAAGQPQADDITLLCLRWHGPR